MSSNKNSTKSNMNSNLKPGVSAINDSRNNRRSSRIQNTKDSSKNETSPTYPDKKSSKVQTKQHNVQEECSENNKNSVQGELEALFDQSDEEDSFGSMFENSFEQQHTKSMNSLVSSRLIADDSMKDTKHNISNTYIATSSSLQPEDVSKVLKILSQPNTLHDASDSKPKPSLKTYCNRRKSRKNNVVESFGLPDQPIVHERPIVNNTLDTEILDASEITILDIKCIDEPWDIPNLNQHDFLHLEEIRVKSDPQKHFKIRHLSGNLEDIQNNDFIFTSTPQIKPSKLPKSNVSSLNRSSDKEVDIDSIKSNIRKLLREKSLEKSPTKTPSGTSHKHGRNSSKVLIQNGDISLEDSEMEIFNTPSASSRLNNATSVKTNTLSLSKINKHQNNHKREEVEVSERRRNLRSSGRWQESTPNNARKSNVSEKCPKHPDNSPRIRLCSNKEDSIDEEVEKIMSRPENQMRNKKKLSSVEHRLGTKFKIDDDIITTPRRILRSKSSLDISLDIKSNKVNSVKKLSVRNIQSSLGRRLRSLSQENISTFDSNREINSTTKVDINPRKMINSLSISSINKNTIGCDGHTPKKKSEISRKMKAKLQSDGVPQLKVLISPLKPYLINDRSQSDNTRKDLSTTRKSLRSYKEAPETSVDSYIVAEKLVLTKTDLSADKLISTEIDAFANRLILPAHSITAKEAPIEINSESDQTSDQEAMLSKRIRHRIPQIFDDGSSSSESVDITLNCSPATLPISTLPEKDVESDENSVGLFTDNFSTEVPDEFQQNELDILNNISEPPLPAEDNVNDDVEMAHHSLPDESKENPDVPSQTKKILDVLPEQESSEQTNPLLDCDIECECSSEPSSTEVVHASEESIPTEILQTITEVHKDEADDLEHKILSEESEKCKAIVPIEVIPTTYEVSPTENQIVSVLQSEKELPISTSPIHEDSTTNPVGSPSKRSSIVEEEPLVPLGGIPENEIDSNKDKTDNTVSVLDKTEPTSVVVLENSLEISECLELQEHNTTATDEEKRLALSINETSDNFQENSTVIYLSAEANLEKLPLLNQDSEVTDNKLTPVVNKDYDESNMDSLPERMDNEEQDEKDKNLDEVIESALPDVSSISTSPAIRNLRKRRAIEKEHLKPVLKHLSVEASPEMLPLVNKDSKVTDNKLTPAMNKDNEESLSNIGSLPETVNNEEVNDEKDKSVDEEFETILTDVSSISTSPVFRNLRKRKAVKKKRLKPLKIRKKDCSYKLRNRSTSYKLKKLGRPCKMKVKTLPASSYLNKLASTSNKRIGLKIFLENNSKCSEISDPGELPNEATIEGSVEALVDGTSTNKSLGDLKTNQHVKRKRGRPRKVRPEKPHEEKVRRPETSANAETSPLPKRLEKPPEEKTKQVIARKRGRPWKVRRPETSANTETSPKPQRPDKPTEEKTGQVIVRKRGRPWKVRKQETSANEETSPIPKRLEKPPEEKTKQVIARKRGRPWKVRRPEISANAETSPKPERLEKPSEEKTKQVIVRKRGRPWKVRRPETSANAETSPKPQNPEMSREVAKLLESESTIVFNPNLVNFQKSTVNPIHSVGGCRSWCLQDKTLVNSWEDLTTPPAKSFNGVSHSSSSQTQLFFEDVFDSQNTIADHVKKRTREVKSYKLSGTNRPSGGCPKSNSFEIPLKQNNSLRSWKSLDFSENTVPKNFEFLESPKIGEVVNEAAEKEPVELPIPSIKPKANGDVTTPMLLDDCKKGAGRPRINSLVKKQPKLDDQENGTQITVTAGTSSDLSNSEASKGTKKSILRSWLNQSLLCEESELSDIEKEMVKRVEKLKEPKSKDIDPCSVEKTIPRSKTSLGARVRGSDIEDTPRASGRLRRKSLDQEASVAIEAEGNAKWKKSFSIIATSRFAKKLKNADVDHLRDIKGNLLKFKVGSIAWAQIGSFPYWPCLITKELGTGLFMKNVATKNIPRTLFHVRFFGDKGRRAWISKHKMMVYNSKEDLEKIYNEMKVSNKFWPEIQYYYVKTIYHKKWTCAVNEAQEIKSKNLKEKLQFFEEAPKKADKNMSEDTNKILESPVKKKTKISQPDAAPNIPSDVDTDKSVETVVKRKSKAPKLIDAPSSLNDPDHDAKSSSRKPKKEAEQESKLLKLETPVSKPEIEKGENKAYTFLPEPDFGSECQAPDQLAVKTRDDTSEVESKTSVDSLAIFSSHSLDAQKALFKRNTLFKGVSKEKVCQFCFKAGDVLKCRGGCNGVYHVRCAVKVLQEKVPRGGRRRLSNKTEPALEEKDVKEEPIEKVEIDESNGAAEKDKENNANLLDDDHVQIITVPSSVYNTPPRKTFPPNFANLTLAEQIDYKMKEIMRKFESKTTYSESAIEARVVEEVAGVQPLSRTRNFAQSRALFPPAAAPKIQGGLDERLRILPQLLKSPNAVRCNAESAAKVVRHVTADSTLDQTSSSEAEEPPEAASAPPKSSGDDSQSPRELRVTTNSLHVTANALHVTANALHMNTNALHVNANSLHVNANSPGDEEAKHVTADCETLDILQSENSNSNSSQLSKQSDTSEVAEGSKYVNPKHFKCGFCTENMDPYCFVCHQSVSKKGSNIRQKCSLYQCSRFYHPECLKLWPQTQWSLIQTTKHRDSQEEIDSFVCPQHVCHTCASDDPRAATSRCSGDKIVKCQRCPSTYHSTNLCVPAGSDILSSTQIVCPRHRDKSKNYTINTTWCFLCSEGGNLVCCETCPTSVHPECLPVNLTDDDKFICEDCESGRLPLYDEIVWVKLGKYRWWPGLVLFPNEIPPNVMNIKHSRGEFVVKFFGTYDHYWVNRGRSFLFQEGDAGDTAVTVKKKVEVAFNRAVEEAVVVHKLKKEFKLTLEAESLISQKPPPYIKIKVNKPVGNVRQMELDLSNTTACECDPSQAHPCGPDSDCLNRLLLTECNPEVCPAGKRCNNQCFEKREYPPMLPYKTQSRGWGLKSLAPIKKGQFVVEYVGEIIDDEEYQRRIQKMHVQKEENYYFLTIDKDRMIDAGPKGNVARFMNHCCQPNCETQKWTVNGDTRVGLFAAQDIPPETELTFNYNLECIGKEKKICRCGAPNCSGFIGVKAKQETEMKRPKKTYKKKEPVKPLILPPCFICGRKGNVGACNNKICNKAYHLKCLKMTEWPESNKFVCPWHNCKICSKRTIRCCVKCINAYCPSHSEGNVRYDNLLGFVCTSHDPSKFQNERVPLKKKRTNVITEESAVTSTTSDDLEEEDEDDLPLSNRSSRRKKTKKVVPADSDSEEFRLDNPLTSTPLKKAHHEPHRSQHTPRGLQHLPHGSQHEPHASQREPHGSQHEPHGSQHEPHGSQHEPHGSQHEPHGSQDETVSSATVSDLEDSVMVKRKRRRSRKIDRRRKRFRLSNVQNQSSTATAKDTTVKDTTVNSKITRLEVDDR